MALVSVVLPTYNRLAFLPEAVESVRAQSFGDWELLVVDDGSTDGTAAYLAGLREPRLRVLARPHSGRIGWLRNQGIAGARGAYVAFHDSDDLWEPGKLEAQLAALRARPGARWCYSAGLPVDAANRPLALDPRGERRPPASGRIAGLLLTRRTAVPTPGVLAERTLLEEVGGFDEDLPCAEDLDLWLRLAARAECVGLEAPLVRIRHHPTQTTRVHAQPSSAYMLRVYEKYARAHPEAAQVCREQQGYYAMLVALDWRFRGQPRQALRAALGSLRYAPTGRPWRRHLAGWLRRRAGLAG